MRQQFRTYYRLTKPGIIYGNILTATGGFLLAANGHLNWALGAALLSGTSLVIGSACVFNNYIDRDIDKKMARTRKRALVSGAVSGPSALIYATILGSIGFSILMLGTNTLTVSIGATGFIAYVFLYGFSKRRTIHSTLIGTISGATPIVAGYCAVTNRLDGGALLLFLILVFWQMPHFYAIALYRYQDYVDAGLPLMPIIKGFQTTKIQIIGYTIAFVFALTALTIFGYAGYSYLVVMLALSLYWLWQEVHGFKTADSAPWARQLFGTSLIIILALSLTLSLNTWLP